MDPITVINRDGIRVESVLSESDARAAYRVLRDGVLVGEVYALSEVLTLAPELAAGDATELGG